MIGAMELEFQTGAQWKRASSSCLEEEDDDVAGLVSQPKIRSLPWFFSILPLFQTGSHDNVYGSRN